TFGENAERNIDRNGMLLPDVAHVGRTLDRDFLGFDRSARDGTSALIFHLAKKFFDALERSLFEPYERGAHVIVAQVGKQHAERREHAGRDRNDYFPNADLARDLYGVQRARAPICKEHEVAGVEA